MNLLLLHTDELAADGTARLTGRRLLHARTVLHARAGDTLRVGLYRGRMGFATVLADHPNELVLKPELTEPPPPRPGVDLILAIPRPKALKKVLPAVASLGVDRVVLLNAARVEKSYFDSKVMDQAFIDELLQLGLEQARDTVPPEVLVRERFKPFVEDELETFCRPGCLRLLPHPPATAPMPARTPGQRVTLAIGPEGGWVPFEVDLLTARGFVPVSLGPRVLRVEVAVPTLLGALR